MIHNQSTAMKKLLLFPILFIGIEVHAQTISNYLSPPYPTNLTSSKSGSTIAWFSMIGAPEMFIQRVLTAIM
jgi:hypothetical protein